MTDLRRAGRLLGEELRYSRGLILKAEERRYFTWEPPKRELPSTAWAKHREAIAESGSDEDWSALVAAYDEVDRLNWLVREVIDEEGWTGEQRGAPWEGPALGPTAELDRVLRSIDRAIGKCEALTGSRSPAPIAPAPLPAPC